MHAHTEDVLEYVDIKRQLQTYAVTPMGQALAAQLSPLVDSTEVNLQLQETSEMVALLVAAEEPPLQPVPDISPYLTAVQVDGFYLEGWQLLEVATCLEVIQHLRRYGQGERQRSLLISRRLARLPDCGILLREIRSAIDNRGDIRDHASPALLRVRRILKRMRERIQQLLKEVMTAYSAAVQDTVVTLRNERFVIPLKAGARHTLRGIVHGESASGATVYFEPETVIELNNQLQHIQMEERRAVREVLQRLTRRLAIQRTALEQAIRIVGEIDFIQAKGRLSRAMQAVAPRLSSRLELRLRSARHPLLRDPIPIDVQLGPEERTLVITGPNTGGKTAALKTVGLLALMAQSGLHIPVHAESILPIFTGIFVDIGDEQNLQQNLSTFSAHLTNIQAIMQHAQPRALVLLDELGAGTDPMEGGPLGVAILEALHQRGVMTLVTTHYSAIKAYAMATPGIACAAVDFALDTLQPRYRLIYGLPGESLAFAIAARLGLPEAVIARARQEAHLTERRSEQLLASLQAQRRTLEEEQQRLQEEYRQVARLREEAQRLFEQAKGEEQRIRQALYAEGQALLQTARQELEVMVAALRRQASTAAFPREAWQRVVQMVDTLRPEGRGEPARLLHSFRVGERVRVRGLNIVGHVRVPAAGNGQVQVEAGNKTITVAASALEPAEGLEFTVTRSLEAEAVSAPAGREEGLPTVLRLLGYTVTEALSAVERYLDQAYVQGISQVRIIHGIGRGRLREAIGELLTRHPLVRRFQAGDPSGGTTLVELEG